MNEELRTRIVEVLDRHHEIVGAYLFGSRSRGDESEASDVDLAVLFEETPGLDHLVGLEDELERATGTAVDVVDIARADAFLALEAIRGERVLERDGRRLDELDLYVLRRAGDLAHFERERRRALLDAGSA